MAAFPVDPNQVQTSAPPLLEVDPSPSIPVAVFNSSADTMAQALRAAGVAGATAVEEAALSEVVVVVSVEVLTVEVELSTEVSRTPLRRFDMRKKLARMAMPVLVIAGRFDRVVFPALAVRYRTYAPRAQFEMFERAF